MAPHWYDYVGSTWEDIDEWYEDLEMDDEWGREKPAAYYWEYDIPWKNIELYEKYHMYELFSKIDALLLSEIGINISYDSERSVFITSYYRRGCRSADFAQETKREELEKAEFNSDKLILKKLLTKFHPIYHLRLFATSDVIATLNEILSNNKKSSLLKKLQKKKNI